MTTARVDKLIKSGMVIQKYTSRVKAVIFKSEL